MGKKLMLGRSGTRHAAGSSAVAGKQLSGRLRHIDEQLFALDA